MKKGRIIQSTGKWYEVVPANLDAPVPCRLPGRFRQDDHQLTNPVAVGDYVQFSVGDDGKGMIEEIEDRQNYLIRNATHQRQGNQILASNIDQAIVVQSAKRPPLNEGFINRFLVSCEAYDLTPLVVINKIDLADEDLTSQINALTNLFESLGYQTLKTSLEDAKSLKRLEEQLKDKTSVLAGPSGVGKSSLLNALDPRAERAVAPVSDYSNKGTHTTTFARLVALQFGGYLVDTPGIREFGLVNIAPWELSLFFPEMIEPRRHCKFNNCTHSHEPSCGVRQAFDEGRIDAGRYHAYLQMLESLEED